MHLRKAHHAGDRHTLEEARQQTLKKAEPIKLTTAPVKNESSMELGRPETYYASPLTKTPSQEKLQQDNMIVALKPASPEKRPEIQSSDQQLVPMS